MRLRDARTGWDIFDITLLRPAGWMAEHSRSLGGGREVWVDFEELNAKGWAEVIEERPCPKIASGPGRVVTATITHANDDVRTLTLGSGEVLYVTGNHRMYSATRQDWVPVKDLEIGEALRTSKGRESVAALGYQRGRHQVYNLEVETEHCYFVGNGEVLTHNMCGPDGESLALTHSDKKSPNPWGKNGGPEHQAAVAGAVADMESRGLTTDTEVAVKTPGGKKDTRFIDAAGYKDGKIVEIHQAGRGLKSNPDKPVSRERDAFRDMRRVPELKGAKRVFHNYKKPKTKR